MHPRAIQLSIAASCAAVALAAGLHADWASFQLSPTIPQAGACTGTSVALFQLSPTPTVQQNTGVAAALWAGAPLASGSQRASGVVHAWSFITVPGMTWQYAWQLTSSSPQPGALFGASIAYGMTVTAAGAVSSAGFLVVGSPGHRLTSTSTAAADQAAGFAEVFPLSNAVAAPSNGFGIALAPPAIRGGDQYGTCVATSVASAGGGSLPWAFASAPGVDATAATDAGAVHAFRRDAASTFTFVASLALPDAASFDRLGRGALAAAGDRVYASCDRGSGSVGVFAFVGGTPAHESTIQPPASGPAVQGFGAALACDGTFLVVGAPGAYGQPCDAGTVFVLDAAPPHAVRQVIATPWPGECAGFGSTVALERGQLVIGTEQGASSLASGQVAVYELNTSGGLALQATLAGAADAAFGTGVAASGAHVAVGAAAGATDLGGVVSVRSMVATRTPDLNHDGIVNGKDLGLLLAAFRPGMYTGPEDLNNDSLVNGGDLAVLLGAWGTSG
jgi:hypothetical protein